MDIQKARVTELHVRMDCNGCVQKIKKALHGIQGIYEVYPDLAQQKLTVIGWADPERIIKAIRKTRKSVTMICSHSDPPEEAVQPPEQPPDGGSAASETDNPPPSDVPPPPAEPAPQPEEEAAPTTAEPPKDQPPPEIPQPEPAPADANANAGQQPPQTSGQKDVGEVHVICHHPPDYGHRYGYGYVHSYGGGPPCSRPQYLNNQSNPYPNSQPFHHEPPPQQQPSQPPVFVTHSYNTHRPSPYVTEYEYVRPPPPQYSQYSRIDHYNEDYYSNYGHGGGGGSSSNYYNYNNYNSNGGNGNITSIFSDENPNACSIM